MRPLSIALLFVAATAGAEPAPPTVGVGAIVHTLDGTSESFGALRALRALDLGVEGVPVEFRLVEHPNEARYAVSGSIDGEIRYHHDDASWAVRPGWGTAIAGGLVGGGLMAGALAVDDPDARSGLWGGAAAGGVALGVGVGLLAHAAMHRANRYSWRHTARLTLYVDGEAVEPLVLTTEGSLKRFEPVGSLRAHTLAALWPALGAAIEARIRAERTPE